MHIFASHCYLYSSTWVLCVANVCELFLYQVCDVLNIGFSVIFGEMYMEIFLLLICSDSNSRLGWLLLLRFASVRTLSLSLSFIIFFIECSASCLTFTIYICTLISMDVDVCAVYMCAHCSQCTVYSIVLDLYWEAMLDVCSASIPLCYFHQRRAFVSIPHIIASFIQ